MIVVQLTEKEKKELKEFRKHSSSGNSEKSLMVLLSNEKISSVKIATQLKRNPHTVRFWLKRYIKSGIQGLQRNYSQGRPREKRNKIATIVQGLLKSSPLEYDYRDRFWTILLIVHYLKVSIYLYYLSDVLTLS